MVVDELDLLIWWLMSSFAHMVVDELFDAHMVVDSVSGSIDLHGVISSSIYTTNKHIGGVNN
jgi:hypothetical protein